MHGRAHVLLIIAALLALAAPAALAARPYQPGAAGFAHRHVCRAAPARWASCNAEVVVDASGAPLATPGPAGYAPADLQSAYGLTSLAASAGGTQTIAIVDAYDDPNAEADLGVYRAQYGLPLCTTANGCFRKVDQSGGTSYPAADVGWAEETSLDLDMASAVCPNCKILLVEANSAAFTDLMAAVDRAAALNATQISNSYGANEFSGETSLESHYDHPGIAITVSSGDSGYGVEFPASSRYVTAVGGTHLVPDASARGWSETAWSGAGSGCSAYVPKPAWQTDSGCANRAVADVSAVADPNTGVAVYDTYGGTSWMVFGGTSAAAPIVAAFDALIGSAPATQSYPYDNAGAFNDVTSGANGSCGGSYLCTATTGYDGPTGVGTPMGTPPAGSKPTVTTQPASDVGAGSAALHGSVNPNGTATTYHFEYGTTTGYGTSTPDTDAGSGAGPTAASASISGLAANTTYHVRLVATSTAGTSNGTDRTFTTGAAPLVTASAPTHVTATAADLAGTVNPGRLATTYRFEYGTTAGYGAQSPAVDAGAGSGSTPGPVSTSLSGLTPGTTYHYRLVATNEAGTSASADQTFTTLAPPVATTGAAGPVFAAVATVGGTVAPNGSSTTYHFDYGTTTAYGLQSAASNAGSGSSAVPVSAVLAGLAANTTYHYRLVATSAAGTSTAADATFTTGDRPSGTTDPAASIGADAASLSGTVTPNRLATTYRFEYGTTTGYGNRSPVIDADAGSGDSPLPVAAALSGLSAATTYHFRLVATNAAGTFASADRSFTTAAVAPPTKSTQPPPCTTAVRVTGTRRVAVVQITCAPAGRLSVVVLRGARRVAHAGRTLGAPSAATTLRLRVPVSAFARARALKLTVSVTLVDAGGARTVLRKKATIRR